MPPDNFETSINSDCSFDQSTISLLECGVTLDGILNSTISSLSTFAVLTSKPESLSESQISAAINLLELYLESIKNQVQ